MNLIDKNNTLKIGIIDSGIDISNERLMQLVKRAINIENEEKSYASIDDKIGHGTACIDLITRNIDPSKVSFYIYKVFDKEMSVDINIFAKALQFAFKDGVDIINCSLGTVDPGAQYQLNKYIVSLLQKGTIIVSAWNDEGYTTWPANFPGVLSVKSGTQTSQSEWGWEDNKRGHVIFRGKKQRVQWKNNKTIFIGGSSFATALCIRMIVEQLIQNNIQKNYYSIESLFRNEAAFRKSVDLKPSSIILWNDFPEKVKRVGIYPFNKEMHAFVRFRKNLHYQIGWIADLKRSKTAGHYTNDILQNCNDSLLLQKGLPDDPGDIDTMIVGYLDKASELQKIDLLDEALNYALSLNINVFTLIPPNNEKEWISKYSTKSLWLDYPKITYTAAVDIIEKVQENKAFDTPILGIFGTSSKQGKFTLQLDIRYELEKQGFRIGQIGTEHHSGCFGIDFTFPSGYGANYSLHIPFDFHIPVLRRVLSEMDKTQYDLIIIGAQSGLINPNPYYYGCIFSELFLTATVPDRTVVLFNRDDPPELIKRTEQYIFSKTGQPVFQKICFEDLLNEKCYKEIISSLIYDIINS